jgi:hypothetical protein
VVEDDNPKVDGVLLEDGRIRVRVWGLHNIDKEEIPVIELPLAQPAYPNIIGSITGVGVWSIPTQGTHVFVFFENGDHMEPRYFATAPGIEPTEGNFNRGLKDIEGFRDPDGTYPKQSLMNEQDMNRLMYMKGDHPPETAWEHIGTEEMAGGCMQRWEFDPGSHIPDYPNNFVLETRSGQTLEMNTNSTLLWQGEDSYLILNGAGMILKGGLTTDGGITAGDTIYAYNGIQSYDSDITRIKSESFVLAGCCGDDSLFSPLVIYTFATAMVLAFNTHKHDETGLVTDVPTDDTQFKIDGQIPTAAAVESLYSTVCLKGS